MIFKSKCLVWATSLLLIATFVCDANAGVFDGQTINYEYYAPDLSHTVPTAPNGSYFVGTGGITLANMGGSNHGFALNILGDYLTVNNTLGYSGLFGHIPFQGFVITDTNLTFTSFSLVNDTLLSGNPVLTFNAHNLYVNWAGLNISPGSVQFAVTAIPEPGEYALMAAGLGLMGFMVHRKKSA